jgi:hypothetical protein
MGVLHLPQTRSAVLRWRVTAFLLGAVCGLTGIFLDAAWLVTVALIVLLLGTALRWRAPTEE